MKRFVGLVHNVSAEIGGNVPVSTVRLTFVEPGYMIGGYISTMSDVAFANAYVKKGGEFLKRLQRIFATDSFGASGNKKNIFVLVCEGGEECDELWIAKDLLLFKLEAGRNGGSEQYAFHQFVEVTRPKDRFDETLG